MHHVLKCAIITKIVAGLLWSSAAVAAFSELSRSLRHQFSQIALDVPVLPPLGHTRFCLRYPGECKISGGDFRRRNIKLTPARWEELDAINRQVSQSIVSKVTPLSGTFDQWLISPASGDCKAYALTKRHVLLMRGWPSRALLLAEVIVPDGQHHLVLVVRTKDTDLVLDNLNPSVRPISTTYRQYQWVRAEMPQNPRFWARVRTPTIVQTASLPGQESVVSRSVRLSVGRLAGGPKMSDEVAPSQY
jgi:predicted transglutaminase-like cysteine proteinase